VYLYWHAPGSSLCSAAFLNGIVLTAQPKGRFFVLADAFGWAVND
jgi:hypothetical protein